MSRLGVTSFVLAALAASPALAQSNTISMGAALQLTGKDANTGRYYRDAYQLAIDKINAKGGVTVGGKTYTQSLAVRHDPKSKTSAAQLEEQLQTALAVRDDVTRLARIIKQVRSLNQQITARDELLKEKV